MTVRIAALIPTFDNPHTIRSVVESVRAFVPDVLVVDDGSAEPAQTAIAALAREGVAMVVRRERNGGKGAAVKAGLVALHERGFSHALQIDADGQHDVHDIPRFLAAAREHPQALITGTPQFDASAPKSRMMGRQITRFWTNVETLGRVIIDPMCGFRIYPLAPALHVKVRGDAMDFDPEIAVAIAWEGVPVLNLPTRVRYIGKDQGGVSHFRLWRDNVLISWMHTRQVCALFVRLLTRTRPRRLSL
jgi:glycosyltransferase involved in cell wall biosynthesis